MGESRGAMQPRQSVPLASEMMEWEKASADPLRRASTGERASKWGEKLDPQAISILKLVLPVHL